MCRTSKVVAATATGVWRRPGWASRVPIGRLCAIAILIAMPACSSPRRVTVTPDEHIPERLTAAEALVRDGCFDCLVKAYQEYDTLRSSPQAHDPATIGAVRTAALLAIRERELGTEDSGYLTRARDIAASSDSLSLTVSTLLDIADTLPGRGVGRQLTDDVDLTRRLAAYRNRDGYTDRLREHADDDPLSAYLWMGFSCAYGTAGEQTGEEWLARLQVWRDAPLIRFKAATCTGYDSAALDRLLLADGRFVEVNYFLGLAATLGGRIDDSLDRLLRAYAWRPRWPAVTSSLANVHLTLEEFDRSVDFFDRTLDVLPNLPDALLGKARALTYLGRYDDSIVTIERLLALAEWYVGDARYWRAFNEVQLGQNDAAWNDLELAARLLINAEVPKLAGIIAYRRQQLDVARSSFQESRGRNPKDCETGFYLGTVLSEQGTWSPAAEVLEETATCLAEEEQERTREIERIRASNDPPERRARQIARREQEVAGGRRMLATSWFNMAAAYYNLSREDEARRCAEKVSGDSQFGERARELLSRLR